MNPCSVPCKREGSSRDRKDQKHLLVFADYRGNLAVLYSDHVKLTRYTTWFLLSLSMAAAEGMEDHYALVYTLSVTLSRYTLL